MTAWDSVMWLHHKLFGQISLLFIVNNAGVNILHLYFYIVDFKMWTSDSFTLNKKLFLKSTIVFEDSIWGYLKNFFFFICLFGHAAQPVES